MNSDIQNIIMKGRIVIKLGGSLITNKEIEKLRKIIDDYFSVL